MKKLLTAIFILYAAVAYGLTSHSNINTVDVSKITGRWDSWNWKWAGYNSQTCTIYFTDGGSSLSVAGDNILFKIARDTETGQVTYINNTNVTAATASCAWSVSFTNIPPNGDYLAELWSYSGSETNFTRTLGQGKITVFNSIYGNDDSTYPWPSTTDSMVVLEGKLNTHTALQATAHGGIASSTNLDALSNYVYTICITNGVAGMTGTTFYATNVYFNTISGQTSILANLYFTNGYGNSINLQTATVQNLYVTNIYGNDIYQRGTNLGATVSINSNRIVNAEAGIVSNVSAIANVSNQAYTTLPAQQTAISNMVTDNRTWIGVNSNQAFTVLPSHIANVSNQAYTTLPNNIANVSNQAFTTLPAQQTAISNMVVDNRTWIGNVSNQAFTTLPNNIANVSNFVHSSTVLTNGATGITVTVQGPTETNSPTPEWWVEKQINQLKGANYYFNTNPSDVATMFNMIRSIPAYTTIVSQASTTIWQTNAMFLTTNLLNISVIPAETILAIKAHISGSDFIASPTITNKFRIFLHNGTNEMVNLGDTDSYVVQSTEEDLTFHGHTSTNNITDPTWRWGVAHLHKKNAVGSGTINLRVGSVTLSGFSIPAEVSEGAGRVTKNIGGTNITVTPSSGVGDVTINMAVKETINLLGNHVTNGGNISATNSIMQNGYVTNFYFNTLSGQTGTFATALIGDNSIFGTGLSMTNFIATSYGSVQRGQAGASVNFTINSSDGAEQSITAGGSDSRAMIINGDGSKQIGRLGNSASVTNNAGIGSIQLFNLGVSQAAYMSGDGSIGLGFCTNTHDMAIVLGEAQYSRANESITVGTGGIWNSGQMILNGTSMPSKAYVDLATNGIVNMANYATTANNASNLLSDTFAFGISYGIFTNAPTGLASNDYVWSAPAPWDCTITNLAWVGYAAQLPTAIVVVANNTTVASKYDTIIFSNITFNGSTRSNFPVQISISAGQRVTFAPNPSTNIGMDFSGKRP